MLSSKSYGLAVVLFSFIFLAAVSVFNAIVDPYGIFGWVKSEGFNARKTENFFQLAVTKPYAFRAGQADNLILGSSRAGSALDPRHPGLAGDNFYNFSTPGSYPADEFRKLQSALAFRNVKRVIYSVDFFTFNHFRLPSPDFQVPFNRRVPVSAPWWLNIEYMQQLLLDYGADLWAYHSLRDSIRTIRLQRAADTGKLNYITLYENGFWGLDFSRNRVPLQAFRNTEETYLRGNWFPYESMKFSMNDNGGAPARPFQEFEKLLELAYQNDVEVDIVILPVHARLLENLDYAGLWPHFEYWKRQLVARNEKVAERLEKTPFSLWDFNGYYPVAVEDVPDDADSAPMQWVFDSAHTHVNTGNRILDIITGKIPADFGGKISGENIDSWLQGQRQLRDIYREKNPKVVKEISKSVSKARKKASWVIYPLESSELEVNKFTGSK